jgi:hypothetical protein
MRVTIAGKLHLKLAKTCTPTNHLWKPAVIETHYHVMETHYSVMETHNHLWKPFFAKVGDKWLVTVM